LYGSFVKSGVYGSPTVTGLVFPSCTDVFIAPRYPLVRDGGIPFCQNGQGFGFTVAHGA